MHRQLLIVLLIGSTSMLIAQQNLPRAEKYSTAFEAVWKAVDENFFDPAYLGVNWKAVRERYRECLPGIRTDAEFVALIREMLRQIPTSHLGFREPLGSSTDVGLGLLTVEIHHKNVVSDVWFGSDAAQHGLQRGDTILSNLDSLDGPWGSLAQVRISSCNGEIRNLRLRREPYGWPFERPSVRWQVLRPTPALKIGYMQIQHFGDDFAPTVDQAM